MCTVASQRYIGHYGVLLLLCYMNYAIPGIIISVLICLYKCNIHVLLCYITIQMAEIKEVCEERMRNYSHRGTLYIVLSLFLFIGDTPLIAGGLVLMATGTLYVFAHINQVSDAADAASSTSSSRGGSGASTSRGYSYVPPGMPSSSSSIRHPAAAASAISTTSNTGDDATYQASFGSGAF